jgi:hypothetical protein
MLVKQLIYVFLLQHLVVQLQIMEFHQMLGLYRGVAALFQCYIEEVVKFRDSLVHGCYSGSYFVEIHFIIWPLRGGYRYPLRGGYSTIYY